MPNFGKLTGEENWPQWKSMMITFFKSIELWTILDGTRSLPVLGAPVAAPATLADVKCYDKDCARIGNIFNNMITGSLFNVYSGPTFTSVREQWQALATYFDRPTVSNKMDLLTQLINVRQQEGQSVDEYFCVITDLINKLAGLQYTVDDQLRLTLCLNGLLQKYSTTVQVYRAKGDQLTWADLHEALRSEEKRNGQSDSSSALMVRGHSGTGEVKLPVLAMGRKPLTCYGCGEEGHFRRNCPKLKGQKKALVKKKSGNSGKAKKLVVDSDDESDETTFRLSESLKKSKDLSSSFVIDSGATKHVVSDRKLFSSYIEFKQPRKVILADGSSVDSVGIGTVRVAMYNAGVCHSATLNNTLHVPSSQSNLLSVRHSQTRGNSFWFPQYSDTCHIYNSKGNEVGIAKDNGSNEFVLCGEAQIPKNPTIVSASEQLNALVTPQNPMDLWHQRMGHIGEDRLKDIV